MSKNKNKASQTNTEPSAEVTVEPTVDVENNTTLKEMLDAAKDILAPQDVVTEEPKIEEVTPEPQPEPTPEVKEEKAPEQKVEYKKPTELKPKTTPKETTEFHPLIQPEGYFILNFGIHMSKEKMEKLTSRLDEHQIRYSVTSGRIDYAENFKNKIDVIKIRKKLLALGFKPTLQQM